MVLSKHSRQPSPSTEGQRRRLPEWLRVKLPDGPEFTATRAMLRDLDLHTVCQGARCPNIFECFSRHVATFMILGSVCTRGCGFCNIAHDSRTLAPSAVDPGEPVRLARAAKKLGLAYVVVTSVTRDDLPDGGAEQFAAAIRTLREELPEVKVEVLIPDFQGSREALDLVLSAKPHVVNHNVETVPALYPRIRPQADFARSLELLRRVHEAGLRNKSGFMVGLGESDDEVHELLRTLAEVPCEIVTIGQYLPPTRQHPEPSRYVEPSRFQAYAVAGEAMGLKMHSAPLVRSSYNAADIA